MSVVELLKKVYSKRALGSHKGDFGRLLVIGGSKIFTGAVALVSMSSLRAGCDLVKVCAPKRAADVTAFFSPNIIAIPLEGDYLHPDSVDFLIYESKKADAVVIGPGLTCESVVYRAVCEFLERVDVPCVIDADAICCVKNLKSIRDKNFIITPHKKEFFKLTGFDLNKSKDVSFDVKKWASKLGVTILLKGNVDVISDGRVVFLNNTGNPYMSKGGTGDVLSGICGAILARDVGLVDTARIGAYISGAAGDVASGKFGEGLLATNVIDEVSNVIASVKKSYPVKSIK